MKTIWIVATAAATADARMRVQGFLEIVFKLN
jgi:hypothetical protein